MERIGTIAPAVLFFLAFGSARFSAGQEACQSDARALCPSTAGDARVACLREHESSLSDGCRKAISLADASPAAARGVKRPWIGEACKEEFFNLCKDLPTNSRRDAIIDCLKAHPENLSHDCAEAITDRPAEAQLARPGHGAGGRRGRRMGDGGSGDRGPYGGPSL